VKHFVRLFLAALGTCSGCSKSPVLTPSQFTKEFVEALSVSSPGLKVEVVRDLELRATYPSGHECSFFLYNAYDAYKQDPSAEAVVMQKFVASFETVVDVRDGVDRTRVIPVIKDRPWLEETRQALLDRGAKETPEYVYDDLNDDLIILYAEDSEANIRYFRPEDLEVAKIDRRELRTLACENLKRLLPKIERHGADGLYVLTAGGDYDASLLLLDSIWISGQVDVRGDIVVAIPTRDFLLITGSEDPEGIDKVRQAAREAYGGGAYRLTPKLFVYRDGGFVEFEDGAEPNTPPVGELPRR
jgi:uncharacterized protein YtpQ (UPF0354 family)